MKLIIALLSLVLLGNMAKAQKPYRAEGFIERHDSVVVFKRMTIDTVITIEKTVIAPDVPTYLVEHFLEAKAKNPRLDSLQVGEMFIPSLTKGVQLAKTYLCQDASGALHQKQEKLTHNIRLGEVIGQILICLGVIIFLGVILSCIAYAILKKHHFILQVVFFICGGFLTMFILILGGWANGITLTWDEKLFWPVMGSIVGIGSSLIVHLLSKNSKATKGDLSAA